MRKVVVGLTVVVAVAVLAAAAPKGEKAGVFAPLEKNRKVSLKETPGGYQIGVVPGVELTHTVVEVGADYVVVADAAGVTETRIPVYAVKAVTVTRLPGK